MMVPGGVRVTDRWVALGPVTGTWWCVLDQAGPELLAPGGVVLCREATLTPHPDAERAARSAWEVLDRWQQLPRQAANCARCATRRVPAR